MTTAPEISVVMPLFNRATTIRRACDSLLAQSWQRFELIIVDDGSTDDGPAIVEKVSDPRVQLVRLGENLGANAARNEGVRRASGGIICFLDSDDFFLPSKLETVAITFASRPEMEGLIDSFRTTGRKRGDRDCRNPDLDDSDLILQALFTRRIWKSTSGISVTRSAAIRAGLFDERLKRRQDYDFLVRLLRTAKVMSSSQISWLKSYSDDGITRDLTNFMRDFLDFWNRHPQYYSDPAFRRGFSADLARHCAKLLARRRFDLLRRDIGLVRLRIGSAGVARSIIGGAAELVVLERYRRAT